MPCGYNLTMLDPEAEARALADTAALVRADSERLRLIAQRTAEESARLRSQAKDIKRRLVQHRPHGLGA
jgi:hypothetical protein